MLLASIGKAACDNASVNFKHMKEFIYSYALSVPAAAAVQGGPSSYRRVRLYEGKNSPVLHFRLCSRRRPGGLLELPLFGVHNFARLPRRLVDKLVAGVLLGCSLYLVSDDSSLLHDVIFGLLHLMEPLAFNLLVFTSLPIQYHEVCACGIAMIVGLSSQVYSLVEVSAADSLCVDLDRAEVLRDSTRDVRLPRRLAELTGCLDESPPCKSRQALELAKESRFDVYLLGAKKQFLQLRASYVNALLQLLKHSLACYRFDPERANGFDRQKFIRLSAHEFDGCQLFFEKLCDTQHFMDYTANAFKLLSNKKLPVDPKVKNFTEALLRSYGIFYAKPLNSVNRDLGIDENYHFSTSHVDLQLASDLQDLLEVTPFVDSSLRREYILYRSVVDGSGQASLGGLAVCGNGKPAIDRHKLLNLHEDVPLLVT